jgi:beta-glucuronidase
MNAIPPLSLNGSWAFRFEEGALLADAAKPDFVPSGTIPVPACFDAMPDWLLKRGVGLYRRAFRLDRDVPAAWLRVDGMGLVGSFFLDGRPLGASALPYSTLRFPAGPLAAGEHVLSAALGNRFDEPLLAIAKPYYDFYLYGGFYHGVSLEFDDRRLRVRTRDFRAGAVEVEAVGFESPDFDATLVFDGRSAVPASFRGGRAAVRVPDFRLWSPESPNLHEVELDGVRARFGIRCFEARGKRLWLNGEPVVLKGANRHEAHPTFGAATPEAVMLADVQNLKALGANFVRGAHYPQAERFLDLCDENGLLVWEESLGWGNGTPWNDPGGKELADPRFRADQLAQTRLMVENSFNHPCVVLYGFLNEFESASPGWKALADELVAAIRSYDSGRLVTFACNHNGSDVSNESTDVVSFNTYPGWIGSQPGTPAQLRERIRKDLDAVVAYHRAKWGDKPILVSETGACGEYGRHDPAAAQWTEEFEAEYLADAAGAALSNPELAGFTVWQLADCRSFHRAGGDVRCKPFAENLAGIYDGYRRPKLPVVAAVRNAFLRLP